jgi:hypothetical protein
MDVVTDIPLYSIIKEIEEKHGDDTRMIIEAMLPDDKEPEDFGKEIPVDELLWWCEFQDQFKVFDNLASVRHWFIEEVVLDPDFEEDERGDRCFHYSQNMEIVRNEEGEIIHEWDEYDAFRTRNPHLFLDGEEDCKDCSEFPEGVE